MVQSLVWWISPLVRYSGLKLFHLLLRPGQAMVLGICRVPAKGLVGGMPGFYRPKTAGRTCTVTQLRRGIAFVQCQNLGHGVVDVLNRILRLRKEAYMERAITVQVQISEAMASGQAIRLPSRTTTKPGYLSCCMRSFAICHLLPYATSRCMPSLPVCHLMLSLLRPSSHLCAPT